MKGRCWSWRPFSKQYVLVTRVCCSKTVSFNSSFLKKISQSTFKESGQIRRSSWSATDPKSRTFCIDTLWFSTIRIFSCVVLYKSRRTDVGSVSYNFSRVWGIHKLCWQARGRWLLRFNNYTKGLRYGRSTLLKMCKH